MREKAVDKSDGLSDADENFWLHLRAQYFCW